MHTVACPSIERNGCLTFGSHLCLLLSAIVKFTNVLGTLLRSLLVCLVFLRTKSSGSRSARSGESGSSHTHIESNTSLHPNNSSGGDSNGRFLLFIDRLTILLIPSVICPSVERLQVQGKTLFGSLEFHTLRAKIYPNVSIPGTVSA